jgi:hypothetical protein
LVPDEVSISELPHKIEWVAMVVQVSSDFRCMVYSFFH